MERKSGALYAVICVSLVTLIIVLIIALALVLKNNKDKRAVTTAENSVDVLTTYSGDQSISGGDPDKTTAETPATAPTVITATATEPVTEKPDTGAPVTEKPNTEAPVTEKPNTEAPVTEKPQTQTTATDKPATQTTATDKPATQTTATEKPATQTTAPVTQKPVTEPPKPEEPVIPEDVTVKSGSLYSSDNTHFRLRVDWTSRVKEGSDTADLDIEIYLECYNLLVGPRKNGVIKVNGVKYGFSTERIDKSLKQMTSEKLAEQSVKVDISGSTDISLYVSWTFNGTISGVEYDDLVVSGTVKAK